jgi:hypothetical protein
MKKWQAGAMAAVALAVVAGAVWWHGRPQVQVTVAAARRDDGKVPAVQSAQNPGAAADQGAAYAFDYSFAMTAPFAGGQDGDLTFHLTGTLDVARPQPDGPELHGQPGQHGQSGQWVSARLRQAKLEQNAVAAQVLDLPKVHPEADAERPFAFHLAADGRVDEVKCDPAASFAARSALAAFAWAWQRARPAEPKTTTWQIEERDANGSYLVHYARRQDGGLDKTWTIGQGDDPPTRLGQISNGSAHIALAAGGVQTLDYTLAGKAATGTLNVATYKPFSVHLHLERTGAMDDAWAAAVQPTTLTAFTAASAKTRQRTEMATRTLDLILADVVAKSGKLDPGGHTNLRNELTRAVAQQPQAVGKIDGLLRSGTLQGEAERLAVEAIVGARTAEAQARVAGMFSDEALPLALRSDLLTAAAFMSSPNSAFVTSLEQMAYNPKASGLSAQAATTLGSAVAFLAEKEPAAAAIVMGRLLDNAKPVLLPPHMEHPQPQDVRQAWLAGLGNTGDPLSLPLILGALADKSEIIRGAAALALRRQDPAAVVGPMVDRMAVEQSVHVRENLVDAARFLGPGKLEEFVEKALRFDHSEHVRLAAAYAMASWSTAAPGLRKVLVDAQKHEKSPKVAEALQNYINQGHVNDGVATQPTKMGQISGQGKTP